MDGINLYCPYSLMKRLVVHHTLTDWKQRATKTIEREMSVEGKTANSTSPGSLDGHLVCSLSNGLSVEVSRIFQ